MNKEILFNELKRKAELVESEEYKEIQKHQISMILSLANSNIEPLELKGMLKLINKTELWLNEWEKTKRSINGNN